MPAEKRIENELTVIHYFNEIVFALIKKGCEVDLRADSIQVLFPCSDMADHEACELPVMGNLLSKDVPCQVVFLVVKKVFLLKDKSTRHLCNCLRQPSRALIAFVMTW